MNKKRWLYLLALCATAAISVAALYLLVERDKVIVMKYSNGLVLVGEPEKTIYSGSEWFCSIPKLDIPDILEIKPETYDTPEWRHVREVYRITFYRDRPIRGITREVESLGNDRSGAVGVSVRMIAVIPTGQDYVVGVLSYSGVQLMRAVMLRAKDGVSVESLVLWYALRERKLGK